MATNTSSDGAHAYAADPTQTSQINENTFNASQGIHPNANNDLATSSPGDVLGG